MTGRGSRRDRIASALAAPINLGRAGHSLSGDAVRRKRYLVVVAAAHIRKLLPAADCTRNVFAAVTRDIERAVTRFPGAKGVNTKFIQRDPLCDRIYRRLRGLSHKAPLPRSRAGTIMTRAELEASVASDRWWICAIKARQKEYESESEADLEKFRDLLIQPLPLEERVRRYAPALVPPAKVAIGRDLKQASSNELAVLFRTGRRQVKDSRAALDKDVVKRALKLAVIHRRRLGLA